MKTRLWPIGLTVCFVGLLMAGSAIYIFERTTGRAVKVVEKVLDWPEKVADGVGQLFQAKTTITNNSVSLPVEDILELDLIQRQILCFTKQENTWMGSTATRIVKGVYTAKAGYDLREGMQITFDESSKTVFITLPRPKVTSLEGIPETFYLGGGVAKWEPSTKENDEGNQLNKQQALQDAKNGLTVEVEERMKERIRDIFSPYVAKIVFVSPTSESPQMLLDSPRL